MSFNKNSHILRKTNTQKDLLYYRNDKKKTKIKKKSVFKINSTIQEGRKLLFPELNQSGFFLLYLLY